MPWVPGQSGNPKGYQGPRFRKHKEVFEEIKKLGYRDSLVTLARIQHESTDESLQVAAASALAPYQFPKLQSLPTPRYLEQPLEVPEFKTVIDAENFLSRIPVLVANAQLDFQSGLELTTMVKAWVDTQRDKFDYELKVANSDAAGMEQNIKITGGLPELPGTTILMHKINGQEVPAISHIEGPEPDPPTDFNSDPRPDGRPYNDGSPTAATEPEPGQ